MDSVITLPLGRSPGEPKTFLIPNYINARPGEPVKRILNIDAGSHTVRREAYDVADRRLLEVKKSEGREECDLGKGMEAESGQLYENGKTRAYSFFFDSGMEAVRLNVDIAYIAGTAAIRHANDQAFIEKAQNAMAWGIAAARGECTINRAKQLLAQGTKAPYAICITVTTKDQESKLTGFGALLSNPEMRGPCLGVGGKSGHGGYVEDGVLILDSLFSMPIGHLWLKERCNNVEDAKRLTLNYLEDHAEEFENLSNPGGAIYLGGGIFRMASRLMAAHANRASITSRFLDGTIYQLREDRVRDALAEIGDPKYAEQLHKEAVKGLKEDELKIWNTHWDDKIGKRVDTVPHTVGMMQAILEFSEAERLAFYRLGVIHGMAVEAGHVKINPRAPLSPHVR